MKIRTFLIGFGMMTVAAVAAASVSLPAMAAGVNGTTLAGYKTLDICKVPDGYPTGPYRYSGDIAVWNEGAVATQGLRIADVIESKVSGSVWTPSGFDVVVAPNPLAMSIEGYTTETTATLFKFTAFGPMLAGDIRNRAKITITNHSGHLGTAWGPEPKATWVNGEPPVCADLLPKGCTFTQGYWGSKPGVEWPLPYDRTALFYGSARTWQGVLGTPAKGNGYFILAYQFIAAKLNIASGAGVPVGVATTLGLAENWFNVSVPAGCTIGDKCGLQRDWAAVLDDYNNGVYPGGPPHCSDE